MKVCENCYKSLSVASKLREVLKKNVTKFGQFKEWNGDNCQVTENPPVSCDPLSSSFNRSDRAGKRKFDTIDASSSTSNSKKLKSQATTEEDQTLLKTIASDVSEILENQKKMMISIHKTSEPETDRPERKNQQSVSPKFKKSVKHKEMQNFKHANLVKSYEETVKLVKKLEQDQEFYDFILNEMQSLSELPVPGFTQAETIKICRCVFFCLDRDYFLHNCYWRKKR